MLLLAGCGRHELGPVDVEHEEFAAKPEKVIVAVFGAPWCSACKTQIPRLEAAILKLDKSIQERIDLRFYVTTGLNSNTAPNQDVADRYRNSLHLTALAYPDPWKWQNFRKWVGGEFVIPGAAVLDPKEKVLKSFRGGATFEVSDISYAAKTAVQNLENK